MANFPTSVYSPRTKENKNGVTYDPTKTKNIYAEDIKKLDAEVVALENFLGSYGQNLAYSCQCLQGFNSFVLPQPNIQYYAGASGYDVGSDINRFKLPVFIDHAKLEKIYLCIFRDGVQASNELCDICVEIGCVVRVIAKDVTLGYDSMQVISVDNLDIHLTSGDFLVISFTTPHWSVLPKNMVIQSFFYLTKFS